jgi:putative sterol carrier protein
MADAVHAILTQDSRSCTGNFFVDETLLRQQGVTDLDQYAVIPGTKDFMLDFFLDENISQLQREKSPMTEEKGKTSSASDGAGSVEQIFEKIKTLLSPDLLQKINSVYSFDLQGLKTKSIDLRSFRLYIGDKWYLDMKNDSGSVGQGDPPSGKAQCTFKMSKTDFQSMFAGKLKPTAAFMGGKLKIQGNSLISSLLSSKISFFQAIYQQHLN